METEKEFVTIYRWNEATTKGVTSLQAEKITDNNYKVKNFGFFEVGRNCEIDYNKAKERAQAIIASKLTSLEKQIERIKQLNF